MKFASLFVIGIILASPLGTPSPIRAPNSQAKCPRIFFSDLESGPNIGGQKNHGVWVTIWGKGFGVARDRFDGNNRRRRGGGVSNMDGYEDYVSTGTSGKDGFDHRNPEREERVAVRAMVCPSLFAPERFISSQ